MAALQHRSIRAEIVQGGGGIGDGPVAMGHIVEREIPFVLVHIHVQEAIGLVEGIPYAGDGAIYPGLAVFLQHDIYDAVIALRVIARGRIGHDFDALDLIGGDLVQRELGLFTIQQDDRRSVSQHDIARSIDAQRGYLAQGVLCSTAFAGQAFVYIEYLLIDLGFESLLVPTTVTACISEGTGFNRMVPALKGAPPS